MKNYLFAFSLLLAGFNATQANDGVYFTSGNFLVPVQETDISVAKEVLTITIGRDSFAHVDVYYEFQNNGQDKNLTMAFEATSSYNDMEPLNRKGIHPHIKDFAVSMNGNALAYRNGVVAVAYDGNKHNVDFTPLDLSKWKGYGEVPDSILPENSDLYNAELKEYTPFGYAYYFDAQFKPGLNTVHHTYRYRMSYSVAEKFTIPYWLTPAMRWANHQVDDFTLKIASDGSALGFCLADSLFRDAPFRAMGNSEIYHITDQYDDQQIFVDLYPADTIVWHANNFKPTADMSINAPLWEGMAMTNKWYPSAEVVITADGNAHRYCADCGDDYLVDVQDYGLVPKKGSRKETYSAEDGKGWVYVDTDEATMVNVRQKPTTKSRVITTISQSPNELPETYQCLGLVDDIHAKDNFKKWYKVKVDGKIGYISQVLMLWDAIGL